MESDKRLAVALGGFLALVGAGYLLRSPIKQLYSKLLLVYAGYRLARTLSGAFTAGSVYLGDKLDLYDAVYRNNPVTAAKLAKITGFNERFLLEWLLANAAAGFLSFDPTKKTFTLPDHFAAVLLAAEKSPHAEVSMAGLFHAVPSVVMRIANSERCMETGRGLTYDDGAKVPENLNLAHELTTAIERWHTYTFKCLLPNEILAHPYLKVNDMQLQQAMKKGGLKICDFGCGSGGASIAMAKMFPECTFHGYDISVEALANAESNRAACGLKNATFANPSKAQISEKYDMVLIFDVVHDCAKPMELLKTVRAILKPGCPFICVDIPCSEKLEDNIKNPLSEVFFGFSMALCLQSSLSQEDSAGLGTMGLNKSKFTELAGGAGFDTTTLRTFRPSDAAMNMVFMVY